MEDDAGWRLKFAGWLFLVAGFAVGLLVAMDVDAPWPDLAVRAGASGGSLVVAGAVLVAAGSIVTAIRAPRSPHDLTRDDREPRV